MKRFQEQFGEVNESMLEMKIHKLHCLRLAMVLLGPEIMITTADWL